MNRRKYKDCLYEARPVTDLKDLVDSSAALFAEKTAYYVKDVPGGEYRPITYKKFKQDVDSLGTALTDMGLAGKKIALIGENSYEWVVSYCAIVNGTGVAVPLDRELPPNEIKNLLTRAEVSALIFSKKVECDIKKALNGIDFLEQTIVMTELAGLFERGKSLMDGGDGRFVNAGIDGDALCTLLFTSGTTGLAKGVMLSHKNISSNVYGISQYVKISEDGIGLSVLPMHHTYEMTCHIFTAIYQGVSVAICEGLRHIAKNMAEIKATVMLGVPLMFEAMHKKVWKQAETAGKAGKMRLAVKLSRGLKLYNHPKLVKKIFKDVHAVTGGRIEMFIAGGAAINPAVIRDFEAMGFPMIQGYGLTETAPIIAVNRDRYSKAASVGAPIQGTEVKIADPDKTGLGEVICRSGSVMLGYYDSAEETEKVLSDDWLCTGDYGYLDEDGMLYISGRKKNVIVTKNGKNIFPEEIEFSLGESKYILESLVHGIADEKSGDTLVKAEIFPDYGLIADEKGELSAEAMRVLVKAEIEAVNARMPIYKRVKRFDVRKTEFSKTTTRKIKRYNEENYSG